MNRFLIRILCPVIAIPLALVQSCRSRDSDAANDVQAAVKARQNLTGNYRGKSNLPTTQSTEFGLVIDPYPGESGNYTAIVLRYTNILGDNFPTNLFSGIDRIVDYIRIYKIVPAAEKDTFNLFPLAKNGGSVQFPVVSKPSQLSLVRKGDVTSASISASPAGEPAAVEFRDFSVQDPGERQSTSTWDGGFLAANWKLTYFGRKNVTRTLQSAGKTQLILEDDQSRKGTYDLNEAFCLLSGTNTVDSCIYSIRPSQKGSQALASRYGIFIDVRNRKNVGVGEFRPFQTREFFVVNPANPYVNGPKSTTDGSLMYVQESSLGKK
jgi:hypothetical protein